jgi:hypothetical protein
MQMQLITGLYETAGAGTSSALFALRVYKFILKLFFTDSPHNWNSGDFFIDGLTWSSGRTGNGVALRCHGF